MATTVTTFADLQNALMAADNAAAGSGAMEIDISGTIAETADPTAIELAAGNTLLIKGVNGGALNGQDPIDATGTTYHRGLFAYSGTVTIQDLTIENAHAVGGKGGDGSQGGGAGAGLGGGLFVGAGANVSLQNVSFQGDTATGGTGGTGDEPNNPFAGGGGGMGGAGGNGINHNDAGGGGIGSSATGGSNSSDGGPGILPGPGGGSAGNGGGAGGPSGGGGGGAVGFSGTGGGGRMGGGGTNSFGGFGGGGGGNETGGLGGFGGGGGAGLTGGGGGFGGGGGGSASSGGGGGGGFGGGEGGGSASGGGGGGGLGAGGDIFVQAGGSLSISGGSALALGRVQGGAGGSPGGTDGQGFGSGIFIQGGTSAAPAVVTLGSGQIVGQTTTVAGVITDQDGAYAVAGLGEPTGTSADGTSNAGVGGIDVAGGTVVLTAANTYTGGTTIAAGTLQLGDGNTTGSIVGNVADGGMLAFDEAVATPLTFSGIISDSGGSAGAVTQVGGTTVLTGQNTYTGGTTLNGGTLELATRGAAGSTVDGSQTAGGVAFGAAGTTLQIDNAALTPTNLPVLLLRVLAAAPPPSDTTEGSYDAPVTNFSSGKTLDLSGLTYVGNGATTASYDTASHTLTVTDGPLTDTLTNFYLGSGLTDGYYTFATSQDANTTNGTDVTLSLNAPSAPVLATGQDTGTSSTDGVTDINEPTFTGTGADPNSTITLYDGTGTTAIGTGTSDANGNYIATVTTALADGPHDITATVTDSGNDVSARSTATSITIDTVPPAVTSVSETGNGIGANGNGDVPAGTVVTFTAQTDGPVYVTPAADGSTPTLTFTNGGVAIYTGQTGAAVNQLTFSYTIQNGQDTNALQLSGITGSDEVTDQAGNPIDLGSLATASLPTGTLVVDTTPPVASSPTDTVAQNSGPAPIGIAAPSDNLTAAGSLAIAAGSLPTDGTVTLADGTPVASGQALTAAQLSGLLFTPTPGVSGQGSTFTYTVTDGAENATQGTAALNVGAAGAPTITGTHATTDGSEAPVAPFTGVTVSDPSSAAGATETLTIALTGQGGTLTGTGLTRAADGSYQLAGTAAQVTQQLDALSFTPTAGAPGTTTSTTFVLTDRSSTGASVTDSGTSVADTAAASSPPPVTPDAVSFSPLVSYEGGIFTLTGTASSASGVRSVEISAVVDGVATDLGAAAVDTNGSFTFKDVVGASLQGFITATETNGAGGTASAQANFSLQGGLDRPNPGRAPFVAEQDVYSADGSAVTSTSLFRDDGSPANDASRRTTIITPGQTFVSDQFDDFKNGGAPETTFAFNPNHGLDTIDLFRPDNVDHDTLSFTGADYGNSIANVLNNTRQTAGGSSIIADPVTGDTVKLVGITKQTLTTYAQQDITFHA